MYLCSYMINHMVISKNHKLSFTSTQLAFCQGLAFLCRRKTRFARLSPPAESRVFGARYSRFTLVAYFSRTVLNRVFAKD